MRQLHCVSHLHYGSIGFTGYDPSIWRLCGWSWQPRGNNYRKERCARKGAHPPFPFLHRAMELLSAPLVRYVAHSPEVAGFVSRAQQVPRKMPSAVRTLPSRLPIPLPLARQLAHQRQKLSRSSRAKKISSEYADAFSGDERRWDRAATQMLAAWAYGFKPGFTSARGHASVVARRRPSTRGSLLAGRCTTRGGERHASLLEMHPGARAGSSPPEPRDCGCGARLWRRAVQL